MQFYYKGGLKLGRGFAARLGQVAYIICLLKFVDETQTTWFGEAFSTLTVLSILCAHGISLAFSLA